MSVRPHRCEKCQVEGVFEGMRLFPGSPSPSYLVGWRCPTCNALTGDLCPVGPVEPREDLCLVCGAALEGTDCPSCGTVRDEARAFLAIEGASLRVEHAAQAIATGRVQHGLAVLDALLLRDPKDHEAWREKALTYQRLQLDEPALRCFVRAIALRADPALEISMACAASALGRHRDALGIYDRLLAGTLPPGLVAIAHGNRGNAHAMLGNAHAAVSDFEEAIRRDPERVAHYLNYLALLAGAKRWEQSRAIANQGLQVATGPEEVTTLLLEKARASNELEDAEVGLEAAEEALRLSPDHPRALYQRAWSLGMLGRLDEGRRALRRLVELEPDNEAARRALAKFEGH